jgi:DNA-directed RNA polymerase specialized sigma subunit
LDLEDSESELKRWVNGDLQNVRITKESKSAKLENRIEEIKNELIVLKQRKTKLLKLIYKFEDFESKLLTLKYIEGKKLFEIAEELHCSESTVYKRHAELVRIIKFVEKNFH